MKRHQRKEAEDFCYDHDTVCGLWVDEENISDTLKARKNSCKNCLKIIRARKKKIHKVPGFGRLSRSTVYQPIWW